MSFLEVCLKVLDGLVKLVTISAGVTKLLSTWRQGRKKKNRRG
ncbi:hypothetical protein [Paenibacillus sp. NFR01]|nr:hypothetical protein [Paenibacillus sp. NFR01]SEU26327.1 hypothetical protein SAMN03159358_4487 [Paenibacillus sp. NFR01]